MDNIKITLCIPQYNRIEYLLKNLRQIEQQSYPHIEVIISDDCSSDDTEAKIQALMTGYKYPIIYKRNSVNKGYDFNLRQSMELASGDYCFILGNDDTLFGNDAICLLVEFLTKNQFPEVGFCNFVEENNTQKVIERAAVTQVIGQGIDCALKHYRSFSFVAGIIYKRSEFEKVNTVTFDGSVFVQMYFAAKIIASGNRFFTLKEPLVLKDLKIDNSIANSYRDTLPKKWSEYKPLNGGIPAVVSVGVAAFSELGHTKSKTTYPILKGIYKYSYTYWLLDYRQNNSLIGALGFVSGLLPTKIIEFKHLPFHKKLSIFTIYCTFTMVGLLTPISLFKKLKLAIYKRIKR